MGVLRATGGNHVGFRNRNAASSNKRRGRKQWRRKPFSLVAQRMREIERIIRFRLPIKTADLKRYLVPYAQHIGQHLREKGKQGTHSEIAERIEIKSKVLGIAYYLSEQQLDAQINAAVTLALKHPRLDKADALGTRLSLTFEDRAVLRITTIGACDVTRAQRMRLRRRNKRERDRKRAARKRVEQGATPRAQYLAANGTSRAKPWERQGIHRATYYRRLKNPAQAERATSPSPSNLSYWWTTDLSHCEAQAERGGRRESLLLGSRVTHPPEMPERLNLSPVAL